MKRILLAAAVVLALLAGVVYFLRGDIALALFRGAADHALAVNTLNELPEGLSAAFCGTGSPLPDTTRAGPCLAVVAGKRLFVFDAGEGAGETLALMGFQATDIEAVFLTHFHSDHIDGLGALTLQHWAQRGATAPLQLYGGEGVERLAAGLNETYALDRGYRIAHHGAQVVPPDGFGLAAHPFTTPDGQDHAVVLDDHGVRITAFLVDHGPVHPAYGYRIDYAGRSIVVSGDTAPSQSLVGNARNADLLVHEALSPGLVAILEHSARAHQQTGMEHIFHDIPGYHTAPEAAADVATQANVHTLALTHLIPPMPIGILEGPFLGRARQHFHGALMVMRDGDVISLPATGGMIRKRLLP